MLAHMPLSHQKRKSIYAKQNFTFKNLGHHSYQILSNLFFFLLAANGHKICDHCIWFTQFWGYLNVSAERLIHEDIIAITQLHLISIPTVLFIELLTNEHATTTCS